MIFSICSKSRKTPPYRVDRSGKKTWCFVTRKQYYFWRNRNYMGRIWKVYTLSWIRTNRSKFRRGCEKNPRSWEKNHNYHCTKQSWILEGRTNNSLGTITFFFSWYLNHSFCESFFIWCTSKICCLQRIWGITYDRWCYGKCSWAL